MNEITQPTGLKAFGWGVLGFFGSNILINLVCFVFLALGAEGVFAFFAFVVAVWVAYIWQQSLKYDATKTGVTLSMVIQSLVFIGSFVGALS
jgi:hypothetical protein